MESSNALLNSSAGLVAEQADFFEANGYLHLPGFLGQAEVSAFLQEIERVEQEMINSDRKKVNGIPIFWGVGLDGHRFIHRMPFFSKFSSLFSSFINSERVQSLRSLLPGDSRIGENENDGLVYNCYTYNMTSKFKKVGWHTDCIRDLFYMRQIYPMLNVGIHLTDNDENTGSLRVLPGTHKQNLWSLLTRKIYYLNTADDPNEVVLNTNSGDLTVHHGFTWHRVKPPAINNENKRNRIVLYISIICGPSDIKHENSRTPLYHRWQSLYR